MATPQQQDSECESTDAPTPEVTVRAHFPLELGAITPTMLDDLLECLQMVRVFTDSDMGASCYIIARIAFRTRLVHYCRGWTCRLDAWLDLCASHFVLQMESETEMLDNVMYTMHLLHYCTHRMTTCLGTPLLWWPCCAVQQHLKASWLEAAVVCCRMTNRLSVEASTAEQHPVLSLFNSSLLSQV